MSLGALRIRRLSWRAVLGAAALVALVWGATAAGGWDLLRPGQDARLDGRRSQAFVLGADSPLTFEIPPRAAELRLLTTGFLRRGGGTDTAASWTYALILESDDGAAPREHHFRSRPTPYVGDDGTARYAVTPLGGGPLADHVPLDGRTALLPASESGRPVRLTLRSAEMDEDIEAVAVRLYYRESVPPHRRAVIWPRLSREQQEQRAVGNVYPPELLTRSEREQLMSWRWTPVAPIGVEGTDFARLVLVQLDQPGRPERAQTRDADSAAVPEGVVLELQPFGAQLRLSPLSDEPLAPGDFELVAGPAPDWTAVGNNLDVVPSPGTRVRARRPVRLRATLEGAERPERLRVYSCEQPVRYALVHGALPTPLRVDVRRGGASAGDLEAQLRWNDVDGRELASAAWTESTTLSDLDWLQSRETTQRASEASRRFAHPPRAAASLDVSCGPNTFVAVYNRPATRQVTRGSGRGPEARDWFVLLPAPDQELQSSLLRLQRRGPAATAGTSIDGRRVADLRPAASTGGRQILLPRSGPATSGVRSYVRMSPSQPVRLRLAGDPGSRRVAPRLLYRRAGSDPFRLEVLVDGVRVLDEEWAGRQGELSLPALAAGSHEIEVRGDGAFFLGSVEAAEGGHVRRLTFRAPRQFDVTWEHDGVSSVVSARIFSRSDPAACRLDGVLVAPEARRSLASAHTFPRRTWSQAQGSADTVAALGTDELDLQRSEALAFAVGDDVPAGPATLRYSVRCTDPAYMTVTHMVPAGPQRSATFRERRG